MDPKQQLSQLDPKLKEAYERVMSSGGTPTSPSSPTTPTPTATPPSPTSVPMPNINSSTATNPFPTPTVNTTTQAATPPSMSPNINSTNAASPQMTAPPISPMPTPTVINPGTPVATPTTGPVKVQFNAQIANAGGTPQPAAGVATQKKKGAKISPMLIVVAGIVFILAYAIFWMKVFNIPIPFLG